MLGTLKRNVPCPYRVLNPDKSDTDYDLVNDMFSLVTDLRFESPRGGGGGAGILTRFASWFTSVLSAKNYTKRLEIE
jgi:hypothetical protein